MLATVALAQSSPHIYVGDIVNANCMQATKIVSINSRGYVPPGANAFAGSSSGDLQAARTRKAILRHCSVNPGVTAFALLTDYGNFFRLSEPANFKVLLQTTGTTRKVRGTVTGFVDRETLNVESISVSVLPQFSSLASATFSTNTSPDSSRETICYC